jgi:CRP-like cAMP-binding protein
MTTQFSQFKNFIQKVAPFIREEECHQFFLLSKSETFLKGQHLIKEDEICQKLLFIHQGLFRYYLLHNGEDITKDFAVDNINPFCTSYTSFMLQKPSEIWIEALEPAQISVWKRSDVIPLFQENFAWLRFSKAMADKLFFRKEQREIAMLKCSAEERYRLFLQDFPGVSQRVSQYHIASYLGIAPESLSRIRSKLAKKIK